MIGPTPPTFRGVNVSSPPRTRRVFLVLGSDDDAALR